jgi:hypothetical protein
MRSVLAPMRRLFYLSPARIQKERLRNFRRELPAQSGLQRCDGSGTSDKTNDLREFATTMFLLVFLRYVLGMLPRTRAVAKGASAHREMVHPSCPMYAGFLTVAPHEWMSMDHVLTESFPGFAYVGRGTFERANHPLRSVFRFARRLAWGPETYLVFAATVSVCNRRPHRG